MKIAGKSYRTVWWENGCVRMIEQRLLPFRFEIVEYSDHHQVAQAIREMVVRGAPAIGAAGAFGLALAVRNGEDPRASADLLKGTRPTAFDLFSAVDFVLAAVEGAGSSVGSSVHCGEIALKAAQHLAEASVAACERIGELGATLIGDQARISTHCNAGWLATVDWGTALAPIYKAHRAGLRPSVLADETRPRGQGAKLTAYELGQEGVEHRVIADNATGHYIARGQVDLVIVGTDRVARNGDIANKIGTYTSALAAYEAGIPFYVAAPFSTIDAECASGAQIPIEERSEREVTHVSGWDERRGELTEVRVVPEGCRALNPGFDVTPAKFITALITERGIFKPAELAGVLVQ